MVNTGKWLMYVAFYYSVESHENDMSYYKQGKQWLHLCLEKT